MRIDVVGKHIEVTPAIQDYASKKADRLLKVFDGTQSIKFIVESPQGKAGEFHCEVLVDVVKHKDFVANAVESNLYAAMDVAVDKVHRQLRDHKDKLRS
jgi:putative sigma-54 modulation protein